MLFNSYIFIFIFLPLTLIGYFLLNRLKRPVFSHIFLLGMCLWFYAYVNPSYLPLILVSILFNFGAYKLMDKRSTSIRKLILIVSIIFNVGSLFYFKYYNFFLENINALFQSDFTLLKLALPLGISFFSFQQLSFVIDAYKEQVPRYNLLEYSLFVTYFPKLSSGPIVTHDELLPQFADEDKRHFNWDNFSAGLYLFALGIGKKVLLADTFGIAANWGFGNIPSLDAISAVVTMLAYTIQIYFDFSGYCDMAIGIGKMMNIDLPLNFNSPYKALTISDFWDRWHMTLTRFFTRYIYIPLGGSRKGTVRTYINIMIVFLVSGLWHGSNWTFILWGALHGLFSVVTRRFKTFFSNLHPALNWLITFGFVNVAWVFFRANSISDAVQLLRQILSFSITGINQNLVSAFSLVELEFLFRDLLQISHPYFFFVLFFAAALFLMLGSRNAYEKMLAFKPTFARSLTTVVLLIWSIFSFSGISTFLYFNF